MYRRHCGPDPIRDFSAPWIVRTSNFGKAWMADPVGCERMLRSCKASKMEREVETSWTLPEHLVEKIISMLPFPSIFKARCLSKSWLSRLSFISGQDDDSKKRLAISFQQEVGKWSNKWGAFCPVFVTESIFIAYDRASERWLKMPSLVSLPQDLLPFVDRQMEGPLLYGFARAMNRLCVINMLTRTWKHLPPHPCEGQTHVSCLKLVLGKDLETYKVIVIVRSMVSPQQIHILIYNSPSDAWISKTFVVASDTFTNHTVFADTYVNEVLYFGRSKVYNGNRLVFMAFDIKKETLEEIEVFGKIEGLHFLSLVFCNGRLLIVSTEIDLISRRTLVAARNYVWEIDLREKRFTEVARYPVDYASMDMDYGTPVCDGNQIFFLGWSREDEDNIRDREKILCKVLAYSLNEDKFTVVSDVPPLHRYGVWIPSSFRPGLRPFMAV